MQHFKSFVRELGVNGVRAGAENYERRIRPGDPFLKELVEACQVFVFQETNPPSQHQLALDTKKLDAPFPVFSVEVAGEKNPVVSLSDIEKQNLVSAGVDASIWISCVLIDTRPEITVYYHHIQIEGSFAQLGITLLDPGVYSITEKRDREFRAPNTGLPTDSIFASLTTFMSQMKYDYVAQRKTPGSSVSLRNQKNAKKKIRIPKNHVFIVGKKSDSSGSGGDPQEVEWTHRWRVRGHWRQIPGIGKNAKNEYCETGRTWVMDCEKGPADKPLIEKHRIVVRKSA